jgi:hypothetical protein
MHALVSECSNAQFRWRFQHGTKKEEKGRARFSSKMENVRRFPSITCLSTSKSSGRGNRLKYLGYRILHLATICWAAFNFAKHNKTPDWCQTSVSKGRFETWRRRATFFFSKVSLQNAMENAHVFLSGAAAGIFEGVIVQPLEMVKTRFQINTGAPMKVFHTISSLVREGGFLRLYRGGLPEIVGLIPRSTAMWSTYGWSNMFF